METAVPGTPVRDRRKGEDSGSDEEYETVATVPVQNQLLLTQMLSSKSQRLTQPTQIIERSPAHPSSDNRKSSIVQVAASSPVGPRSSVSPRPAPRSGLMGTAMAPSGTRFCPPANVKVPARRAPVLDSEDEGPTYRGASSDEDDVQVISATDIKPATFGKGVATRSPVVEKVVESPVSNNSGAGKFREITASAYFQSGANGVGKRSAAEADAERLAKKPRQDHPSHALPIADDDDDGPPAIQRLEDIRDYAVRVKTRRILSIYPRSSINECYSAVVRHNGNYDEALKEVGKLVDKIPMNLISDDELALGPAFGLGGGRAKQQIKAKNRIQDKWASSQGIRRQSPPTDEQQAQPRKRLIRGSRTQSPQTTLLSPVNSDTSATTGPKKLSRLVQGRKKDRPRSESPDEHIVVPDDSDSDAAVVDDSTFEGRVLDFFNTCGAQDLADIAAVTEDVANTIISHRPFSALDAVRTIQDASAPAKPGKRNRKAKPIGDKIVDKCMDMWTGYEAVDALVTQCEAIGKPIAAEMKNWGVDVFGKKDGELEMTSLDEVKPTHDSGIGTPEDPSDEDDAGSRRRRKSEFISQPKVMNPNITMKDYQVVGINWLNLLFKKQLSCILADDMGLGKTCQVIGFLAHLYEQGIQGPHLVVVPASTLENWLREFKNFCPKLEVVAYYGDQNGRAEIRQYLEDNLSNVNVIVTTYTVAKGRYDTSFLKQIDFSVCVYDEGHMLKNSKSMLYEKLIRLPADFRLLLTGTPLQNNLQELASLLGFILPSVFKEKKEDLEYVFSNRAKTVDEHHSALLSAQRITRAKSMLTPFVLRRKKHQVIDLPAKIARVEYCEMNPAQKDIYTHEQEQVKRLIADRAAGIKTGNQSANILMKLRQVAIHPLLHRRHYDDKTLSRISKACLKVDLFAQSDPDIIYEELLPYNDFEVHGLCLKHSALRKFALGNEEWMRSGKVEKLVELLKRFQENGDRALIFSQFTMVMDILEHVLETIHMGFYRLDGRTTVDDRQAILDAFHENTDIPVFLLSTKAGGAGINLACANKVVIFDSSFNPQEDVQAENRAHRVGQTREVEVIRMVTKDTIEEQIYALGQTKLALDDRVAGDDGESKKTEEANLKVVENMVIQKLEKEEHKDEEA